MTVLYIIIIRVAVFVALSIYNQQGESTKHVMFYFRPYSHAINPVMKPVNGISRLGFLHTLQESECLICNDIGLLFVIIIERDTARR